MDNRCFICGVIIPEGRQVCPACEGLIDGSAKLADQLRNCTVLHIRGDIDENALIKAGFNKETHNIMNTGQDTDYAATARVIALWLKEFCDYSLPYDQMIAEAARKAAGALAESRRREQTAINDLKIGWSCRACKKRVVGKEWCMCKNHVIVKGPENTVYCVNFDWHDPIDGKSEDHEI